MSEYLKGKRRDAARRAAYSASANELVRRFGVSRRTIFVLRAEARAGKRERGKLPRRS